jgi:hypothetical protein
MIVVTGATGALNGATVEHLLGRIPAEQIGVSVRDVAKAQHFADRGVRVRQGSYEDPTALRHSFEGAEQVLLVSSNDRMPTRSACIASASTPPSRQGPSASSTPATRAPEPTVPSARRATTPPPSSSSPTPASPGPRCATASTPTVLAGCSVPGGRPV